MNHKLLSCFIICVFFKLSASKGYFTIIGSNLIRHHSTYSVFVTSEGYDEPQILKIGIKGSDKYENFKNITLKGGKPQKIDFDMKHQKIGDYKLEVKSLTGDNFEKSVKVHMNTKKYSVFIQTDKSVYKPADIIQFRVLILNANTKPFKTTKQEIFITDGGQNRVKQFENIELNKGVYQNELQLSDSPVMGDWMIHVKVNDGEEVTKIFEVAEYVLPKFEVIIKSNPYVTLKDGKIRASVKGKYTFGKMAKGNATITAKVQETSWWAEKKVKEVSKSISIDGKKEVEFDIKDELGIQNINGPKIVDLSANFTDELSGRDQTGSAIVTIHTTPHKIEIKKSKEKFKPTLPFNIKSIVKYHDDTPVVLDLKHPVEFTVTYFQLYTTQCESYSHGFGFKPLSQYYECDKESSYSETTKKFLEKGIAELNLVIPSNTSRISIKAKYIDTEESLYNIKKAESESNEFIQASLANENLQLNKNVLVEIIATNNLSKLFYQVVGRGSVITSDVVSVSDSKSHQFSFKSNFKMVPKSNLIIFYITSNGEIISDQIELLFENQLQNYINIELSSEQTKPGDTLNITIKSNQNSFVGLLGVDQSVLLLKKGNDIENSEVVDDLKKYSKIDKMNFNWYSDYSAYSDFKASDTIIITNAKKEYYRPYKPVYHYGFGGPFGNGFGSTTSISGFGGLGGFGGSSASAASSSQSFNAGASFGPSNSFAPSFQSSDGFHSSFPDSDSPNRNIKQVEIRKTFPETWLFDSFELNELTNGTYTLSKKVPDTITSWIITGFAINPVSGLGLTKQPSKFNVFQPFFVSTNLPYSIKRGEVVAIPIVVFNYMDRDQKAEVTLFNTENDFEFTEINEDGNEVSRKKRATETQRKKNIFVKSNDGTSVSFMIKPLKVGHITIKVVATSPIAGDGVERQLVVEPEGVTQYMNKAIFIDLRNNPEFKTNISIIIPPNALPDSTKIEASAIGDILGPSIDNLDKLIKLPYGCGEQNMLNFVPNIVVLEYLTTLNKLTPEIEAKTKKYMESGYQRELTYKHDDGSYSAFGKSDTSGSTWLTAFVAKSFYQASKFIMIDKEIIEQALAFLSQVQAKNGSFPEVGHVSHKDMQGGSSSGIALTAYTLITFLENQNQIQNYQNTINKALDYIVRNIDSLDDNYSLAIATYALQLAKHSSKDSLFSKLVSKSENKNGMKYWQKTVAESDQKNPWNKQPNSVNVEMSAYALQSFLQAGSEADAIPIMKWLVAQRNENGGFQSTQDTVVGLQALSKLATKIYSPNSKVDISLKYNKGLQSQLNVNAANALILQKYELPPNVKDIEVSATGRGFSILQLSYKYNMNVTGAWPRFVLHPQVNRNSNKDFLNLTVCTSFVLDDLAEKSNMAVMEVSFPSGYTFDTDHKTSLEATEKVKKVETKGDDTVVVVYFDDISSRKLCPEFLAYRTHKVANHKPAPVVVYDYYDNSRRATEFYSPAEVSLCDICDGIECKDVCEVETIQIE